MGATMLHMSAATVYLSRSRSTTFSISMVSQVLHQSFTVQMKFYGQMMPNECMCVRVCACVRQREYIGVLVSIKIRASISTSDENERIVFPLVWKKQICSKNIVSFIDNQHDIEPRKNEAEAEEEENENELEIVVLIRAQWT